MHPMLPDHGVPPVQAVLGVGPPSVGLRRGGGGGRQAHPGLCPPHRVRPQRQAMPGSTGDGHRLLHPSRPSLTLAARFGRCRGLIPALTANMGEILCPF